MNPAHVFLISLAWLVTFWFGVLCGSPEPERWKNPGNAYAPATVINLAFAIALFVSLGRVIAQAL